MLQMPLMPEIFTSRTADNSVEYSYLCQSAKEHLLTLYLSIQLFSVIFRTYLLRYEKTSFSSNSEAYA